MERKSKLWHLENLNLLKKLSPEELMEVAALTEMKLYAKGEIIYIGAEADKVYFLKSGKAKLFGTDADGNEVIKAVFATGELFGKIPYLYDADEQEKVIAAEESLLCSMDAALFAEMVQKHSNLSMGILKLAGLRLQKMQRRLDALVFKDSRTRITEFLKDMMQLHGENVGEEVFLNLPLSHREIATLTATSRQTVTTILNELKNRNIIDFDRRRIIIRNTSQLF